MAAAISADADTADLRILWLGAWSEEATTVTTIDGAALDADIEQYLDDVDAVSTAGTPTVSLSGRRQVTGMAAAPGGQTFAYSIANILVLTFSQVHPLNASKTINKSVQLRSPIAGVIGTDGALIIASVVGDRSSPDENLRGLITFLEDNLVYEAIDASLTVGGWTFNLSKSAFITAASVIDGA